MYVILIFFLSVLGFALVFSWVTYDSWGVDVLVAMHLVVISTVVIYWVSSTKLHWSDSKLSVVSFFTTYLIIVLSTCGYVIYLDYKVSTFDLDGDGLFPNSGLPKEYYEYSEIQQNDLSRNLMPITGFVFSLVYSFVFYIVLKLDRLAAMLYRKVVRSRKSTTGE